MGGGGLSLLGREGCAHCRKCMYSNYDTMSSSTFANEYEMFSSCFLVLKISPFGDYIGYLYRILHSSFP